MKKTENRLPSSKVRHSERSNIDLEGAVFPTSFILNIFFSMDRVRIEVLVFQSSLIDIYVLKFAVLIEGKSKHTYPQKSIKTILFLNLIRNILTRLSSFSFISSNSIYINFTYQKVKSMFKLLETVKKFIRRWRFCPQR